MTFDDELLLEIERGEQWLREHCPNIAPPSFEEMKLRARIAAQEQWLAERIHDDVPSELIKRTRRRVRPAVTQVRERETASSVQAASPRRRRAWIGSGVGLAAAAAIGAALWLRSPTIEPGQPIVPTAPTSLRHDWEDAVASAMAALDEQIGDLELPPGEDGVWDSFDADLKELSEGIDDLWWEAAAEDG